MLDRIISSHARIVLLTELVLRPGSRAYLRELVKRSGLPQGSVQRELANLVQAGLLIREQSGRQTYYRVNESCPIVPELRSILIKTVGVADALREALQPETEAIRCAFVFGSFAEGTLGPDSDLDVFIVGSITLRRAVSLLKHVRLSREVNPVVVSEEEFASRMAADDHFFCSVADGPKIFLIGDEDGLRRVTERRKASGARDIEE